MKVRTQMSFWNVTGRWADKAFVEDNISVYREKKDTVSLLTAAFFAKFAVQFLLILAFSHT